MSNIIDIIIGFTIGCLLFNRLPLPIFIAVLLIVIVIRVGLI